MTTSGTHAGLDYDLARPETPSGVVAVLLHGRGSHKGDLQALGPVLPDGWTVVTPQAPTPGEAWGYGGGWAWYRYAGEDRAERETLDRSLDMLHGFLDGLTEVVGFEPEAVVLGGFSQGGTMSLGYALTHDRPLAAVWNFSGFLEGSLDVPTDRDLPPIYWGHGVSDAAIPLTIAERGRARLQDAGAPLAWSTHPIGHWIVPEEIHEAVALVK